MQIHCSYDRMVPLKDLKEHPKNFNRHTAAQIQRFADILKYQGIRRPIRVSTLSGCIVAGHGLLAALQSLKASSAPCDFQDYESEDQEIADLVADNELAKWAEIDRQAMHLEIPSLGPDFDLSMLGFKDFKLDLLSAEIPDKCPECGGKLKKK